jgi:hypothetical protein
MTHLIWINLTIIAMDVVLLAMEYDNRYEIEATLKPMVYSIKLKLEFAVLNQLMTLANASVRNTTTLELDQEDKTGHPSSGKPSLWDRARRRSESTATTSRTYSSRDRPLPTTEMDAKLRSQLHRQDRTRRSLFRPQQHLHQPSRGLTQARRRIPCSTAPRMTVKAD